MIPVNQTILDDITGNCFQACVASIFEFPIEQMPNFWEQTQNVTEFWKLNDKWTTDNLGCRCVSFQLNGKNKHLIDDVLCVACAKSPRGDIDHAVVWKNKIIHDPHPSNEGLSEEPDTFTLFIPLDPNKTKE